MRSNDETKLPQWAQKELRSLRERLKTDVKHWRDRALEAAAGVEGETDTLVGDGEMGHRGLPTGTRVRFLVWVDNEDGHTRRREFVDAHVTRAGVLELTAGDVMAVEPRASNSVYVKVRG